MREKLEVKDLINIGLFSALYIVCFFAVAMLGFIPIFMVLVPFLGPLVSGIPFMLFVTKVRKFGMVTIMGIIVTLLMFATGHGWYIIIFGAVFGLIGDIILYSCRYTSKKCIALGYALFSEWSLGAVISLFFGFRDSYFGTIREGYGDVYADKLMDITPDWMFFVMMVLAFVGAIFGAVIGQKVLKKHFKKAGILS